MKLKTNRAEVLMPAIAVLLLWGVGVRPAFSQIVAPHAPSQNGRVGGSSNIKVLSHVPLGGFFRVMDIEVEQELDRPYAYVSQAIDRAGFSIIDLSHPEAAKVLYSWVIPDVDLHQGLGGMDGKYFKLDGKYYYVQSFQFLQGGPDGDLGAIVFDVTGLPDASRVREAARIRFKAPPPQAGAPNRNRASRSGGFHNIFAYKHSNGRVLLFTTVNSNHANIYDMGKLLGGDPDQGLIGPVPVPPSPLGKWRGYHDFYVGFDPGAGLDKFYGAGADGYHVYDVTHPETPELLFSISGVAGVTFGHTFTPTPDGAFAVTETEYQFAPLRLFDLRRGQAGKARVISRPVGAWTADWHDLSHNHEVRWPYVFVSAYEDGLQVFNMADPANAKTVAWYFTFEGPHNRGFGGVKNLHGTSVFNGAFGVDVRNADGLIVISDSDSGFWAFRMEGFQGWNGEDWAMPNISSAQDWDHGPAGREGVGTDGSSR